MANVSIEPGVPKGVKIRISKSELIRQQLELESKETPGEITEVSAIVDKNIKEVEFYKIKPPFSFARITYNETAKEYLYEAIEPKLSEKDKSLLNLIKDTLERTLGYQWEKMGAKDKEEYLKESVDSYLRSRGIRLNPVMREKIIYYIVRDFVGYGPIDVLMNDEMIEDISCDGVEIPLYIYHKNYESIKTNIIFKDEDLLNSFVVSLGQRCSKQISVSQPILDGTTFEGHRIQATYSREVTTRGASFTIRRFKETPFTPVDLVLMKTASAEMVAYLWIAVEHGESMIICGGPASGKTSTLNSVAMFIPPAAKIVTMEDTREINLPHENWIPGTTRTGTGDRGADGKAAGEIDMFDLIRAALRQRPNYIIVGEVRGKETYTMFQAMATGHTTYSTMHADSVKSMVNRLENPPISTPRILLSALNNVIIQLHARVGMSMVRRIKQLIEIVGFEPETNELITNTVYEWDQATDSFVFKGHSFLFDKLMEMKNMTNDEMMEEFGRRVEVINYLVSKKVTNFRKLAKVIVAYFKDPKDTLDKIRTDTFIL